MTGLAPFNPKRVTFRTEYAQLLGRLQVSSLQTTRSCATVVHAFRFKG
jgi:hypothetical protein